MIEIDLSGLKCPEPYIKLVESICDMGGQFLIRFDDIASTGDIERLLKKKQIDITKKECLDGKIILYCKERR